MITVATRIVAPGRRGTVLVAEGENPHPHAWRVGASRVGNGRGNGRIEVLVHRALIIPRAAPTGRIPITPRAAPRAGLGREPILAQKTCRPSLHARRHTCAEEGDHPRRRGGPRRILSSRIRRRVLLIWPCQGASSAAEPSMLPPRMRVHGAQPRETRGPSCLEHRACAFCQWRGRA